MSNPAFLCSRLARGSLSNVRSLHSSLSVAAGGRNTTAELNDLLSGFGINAAPKNKGKAKASERDNQESRPPKKGPRSIEGNAGRGQGTPQRVSNKTNRDSEKPRRDPREAQPQAREGGFGLKRSSGNEWRSQQPSQGHRKGGLAARLAATSLDPSRKSLPNQDKWQERRTDDMETKRDPVPLAERAASVKVENEGDTEADDIFSSSEQGGNLQRGGHSQRGGRDKKRGSSRGSLTRPPEPELPYSQHRTKAQVVAPTAPKIKAPKPKSKIHVAKVEREVFIPPTIRVGDLARIVDVRLLSLNNRMRRLGFSDEQIRSDHLLSSEDASLIAMEYGLTPIVDVEKSFDIYPEPEMRAEDLANYPLRPPVVTIMGHVDHGKTTLLDALRHTTVAAGEAGGITQHIGAFSVPISSLIPGHDPKSTTSASTITFLDTPGHAAFTGMRARGAHVTDIIVLVVAADDGVMPQTKEVINLAKAEQHHVGLVVAINKVDKPGIDLTKLKSALGSEEIFLEEDGGDVPAVHVSGLKKIGLDDLVETLSTVAEVRDLRAPTTGKAEGVVLESKVEKGRGNVATVLVTRGTLKTGHSIVAGQTWCKVRQMTNDKGVAVKEALPGSPVTVIGWRELPKAGDELLEAVNGEDEAKKAIANRIRDAERKALLQDVEQINEKRRIERERLEQEAAEAEALEKEGTDHQTAIATAEKHYEAAHRPPDFKELRLIIRADVSGTVEAVVGALEDIGNKEAGVKIIHTGVGDVTDSDVAMAEAAEGMIIGFSVKAPRAVETQAAAAGVPVVTENVIYRLIETVRDKVAGLLPPVIESRVLGEATVQEVFAISLKGKATTNIAGCRVTNGVISKTDKVRVLRGESREVVYEGVLESLKHVKKDIHEARKGGECGMSVEGFQEIKAGDVIVAYSVVEKPAVL